ncbi:Tn3 family transposase [Streptomyces sp. NPDC057438]|uniref:Tn3 family transposase n=1 Tax=Streptomyces sp. NPDC057438 TaxID=3346133 RepID=UPI0036A25679
MRRELHGGLQVVENWNSANTVLHYGKDGALTGPDKKHAETSMLALHVLQSALVHVNTLLLQHVFVEPEWARKLGAEGRRGLNALFTSIPTELSGLRWTSGSISGCNCGCGTQSSHIVGLRRSPRGGEVKENSRGPEACSVTVLGPAAGLRCDFRRMPFQQ